MTMFGIDDSKEFSGVESFKHVLVKSLTIIAIATGFSYANEMIFMICSAIVYSDGYGFNGQK
jgi:hypothetical protein